jgi:hypothetical protein
MARFTSHTYIIERSGGKLAWGRGIGEMGKGKNGKRRLKNDDINKWPKKTRESQSGDNRRKREAKSLEAKKHPGGKQGSEERLKLLASGTEI